MLEHFFNLTGHRTTVRTEAAAGLVTFLTSSYILAVNPQIMAVSGMPVEPLFTATALAIICGTLAMGLFANLPLLLAPGMGLNIYFAYSIVAGKGYSWNHALTAVFLSGLLFFAVSLLGVRSIILRAVPESVKHSLSASIGLMIAALGLKNAGVLVFREGFVSLGDVTGGAPLLALLGIAVTGVLLTLRFRAAVLAGIIATTLLGMATGVTDSSALSGGIVSLPPSIAPISMAFGADPERIFSLDFAVIVFTLFCIDMFDSLGTFVGVFDFFGGEEKRRYDSAIPRALLVDAGATAIGACLGVNTVTTYVESATGITAGGRTGLTAAVAAGFMILALFLSPLILMIPPAATAPAMVVTGMFMMQLATRLDYSDFAQGLPAIASILVTVMTFSISDGLMFGWIGYLLFMLASGRRDKLDRVTILVGVFFLIRMVLV
ncbi:MAG: NCS2 family permease [Planctomycetota bacterium]|jgi:AGZA family xanthine/uracil permease-like MFS transporter|nr:NCS2 family permease [Planctomycetota bacterium]